MKLIYISNSRIPTEKAYGVQIVKMCEAFAKNGIDVTLLIPKRRSNTDKDLFSYYGVAPIFKIKKLPVIDLIGYKIPFAFMLAILTFAISASVFLLFSNRKAVLYTRGEIPLFLVKFLPKHFSLFWETHIKPSNMKRYAGVIKRSSGLIVVTKYYKKELKDAYNIDENKILYIADGVDIDKFNVKDEKSKVRKYLKLPQDKKIILYSGSNIEWKGLNTLYEATNMLSDDYLVVLMGNHSRSERSNILYTGHRPYTEMPMWMKASDAFILTGTKKNNISNFYTSPLKMFEYMSSGSPIVASDILSFRDILNEKNSVLVAPDDPKEMADGIKIVCEDDELARRISSNALSDVAKYSWINRAKNIEDFINNKL
ncbi:MAG: glycosyltransferase family 4 protein [Patescibacteria group bacterium]